LNCRPSEGKLSTRKRQKDEVLHLKRSSEGFNSISVVLDIARGNGREDLDVTVVLEMNGHRTIDDR